VDRGTPLRVDKKVAPDREGTVDKQCQGEGKLRSQSLIINRKEGKGQPPRLFPTTEYPLGYPEPALQQKIEERQRDSYVIKAYSTVLLKLLQHACNKTFYKLFIFESMHLVPTGVVVGQHHS